MSSRSALDSLLSALIEGWPFDLDSGESIKFLPAVNDRGFFQIGNGAKDFDVKIFLGGAGSYVLFDSGGSKVTFSGIALELGNTTLGNTTITGNTNMTGDMNVVGNSSFTGGVGISGNTFLDAASGSLTGFNVLSTRYELKWTAGERGKPGIAADAVENTTATFAITDPMFEVTGTNAVSASVSVVNTGGILLTTAGAANDQVILGPHSTSSLSGWAAAWNTSKSPVWECRVEAGADIVNSIIWAGLKLTSTPVATTDEEQVFFRYETAANANAVLFISSIANTDVSTNTGVAVANGTALHFQIWIDGSRIARAYINGTLVHTTAALTADTDLIPFVGVQSKDAAAASLLVRGQSISKDF